MAAQAHTTPAALSAIVSAQNSDVARLLAGMSRLQVLHDEAATDVAEAGPEPEDTVEAIRADLDALVAETRANTGDSRIADLDEVPTPSPDLERAQVAHFGQALHGADAHAVALGEALGILAPPFAMVALGGDGGAAHPDAALLALGRQWEAVVLREDAARAASDAAALHCAEIPAPEALFLRPSGDMRFRHLAAQHEDGRLWFPFGSVERLREWQFGDVLSADSILSRRRRDEVVTARDGLMTSIDLEHERSGYNPAEAESDAATDVNRELRRRIMTIPAVTLADVMVNRTIGVALSCFNLPLRLSDAVPIRGATEPQPPHRGRTINALLGRPTKNWIT